jgi:hypothetical protein
VRAEKKVSHGRRRLGIGGNGLGEMGGKLELREGAEKGGRERLLFWARKSDEQN